MWFVFVMFDCRTIHFFNSLCNLIFDLRPKACDFEVAEELQDEISAAAAAAAAAAGLKMESVGTKWIRFGSVGGAGKPVNPKAVNRLDSVEVRLMRQKTIMMRHVVCDVVLSFTRALFIITLTERDC
jgi:hypothetical protein